MCCLHPDVERVEEEIYPPHCHPFKTRFWWVKVFNSTFNNISVISWQSVLLVEETRVPIENYRPAASH